MDVGIFVWGSKHVHV